MISTDSAVSNHGIVSSKSAPRGCIRLIEPQKIHFRVLEATDAETTIVVRLNDMEPHIEQGRTADTLFPSNVSVITTTTVNDEYLETLNPGRELSLVRRFEPRFHIPSDYPVYRKTDRLTKADRIKNNLVHTFEIAHALRETRTEVIPLVKGVNREDWAKYRRVFSEFGVDFCARYVAQYFTGGLGPTELVNDVRSMVCELPDTELMILGLLSPRLLQKLPPEVAAASGLNQWLQRITPRQVQMPEATQRYAEFEASVNEALSGGQAPIEFWLDASQQEVA